MKPPPDVGRLFVLLAGDGFKPFQDLHMTSFALTEILPGKGRRGRREKGRGEGRRGKGKREKGKGEKGEGRRRGGIGRIFL